MTTLHGGSLLTGLVLTAMTAVSWAADAPSDSVKIRNLMVDFWAFQDEVPTLKKADRILRRFREQIIDPNRDIYSKGEFRDAITDAGIASYLREVGSDLPQMRSMSANLELRTREVVARFKQQFPRFDGRVTIVYLPSLHSFDAQYTRILDQPTLLFGLDAIARFRGRDVDFDVLLAHELFHAHHARMNASLYREAPTALYARIWMEGLAAYASELVNPQASSLQIIGDTGAPIDRSPALVGPLAEMIRVSLDSVDPTDQVKFLTYTADTGVPRRSGDLVGYQIAKALSAKTTLSELIALRGGKLRNLMGKQLEQMSAAYLAKQGGPASSESAAVQTAETFPK